MKKFIESIKFIELAALVAIMLSVIFIPTNARATQSFEITAYNYQHNVTAGNAVTFSTTIRNTGDTIGPPTGFNDAFVYVQVILTNSVTGAPIGPAGATSSKNLTTGASFTSTTSWTALAGSYTVTLIVYSSPGGVAEVERTRKSGAFPVRVGSSATKETLKTFPSILDFGILPYGRHMYPMPLEITYDFFLYDLNNEQQPWYMRIYTDNTTKFKGIKDSVYATSPAGLVSASGRYTIPLRVWCLNYPPEDQEMGWDTTTSGPPPVDDDTYWKGPILDSGDRFENKAAWLRIPDYSEMTQDRGTWRNLIGQDITDSQYVTDVNPTGDFTLKSPFSIYFATETNATSVKDSYSCNLVLEIYSP